MKKLSYWFMALGIMFSSCSKDEVPEELLVIEDNPEVIDIGNGLIEIEYNGSIIGVQETDSTYIYEGDIILDKDSDKSYNKAVGVTSEHRLWEDGIVYYAIDPTLPNPIRVHDAIKHWESKTSIRFKERTTQTAYVYFVRGSGCSSSVGKTGYRQNITLADACSVGNTVHEIGHAIGLWHEQSRVDRDEYVKINFENIISGYEHNFSKVNPTSSALPRDLTDYLDFGSIMMYSPYSFSSNGRPTITKLDGSTYSVQRYTLSSQDIEGVNIIYPSVTVTPEYINGEYYLLYGVWVLRKNNTWMYWSRLYGWKEVYLRGPYWYYVK